MKRSEFIENIDSWWELKDVNDDFGCGILDDFMDAEARDEDIDDVLMDLARNNTWRDMYSILARYYDESGYDYYLYDTRYGEYRGIDEDDFDEYKQQILEWVDTNGEWDPEEDTEYVLPNDTVFTEDNDVPVPDEDCSIVDMFTYSMSCIGTAEDEAQMSVA